MTKDLQTAAIWQQIEMDCREFHKRNPEFAKIINPNNTYKK